MKNLRARFFWGLLLLPFMTPPAFAELVFISPGVWEGTLGTKAIVACFNFDYPSGSYFYKQYKKPIQLTRKEQDGLWHEANETGLWLLDPGQGTTLSGTWSSVKDALVKLPISLSLVDSSKSKRACGSESYTSQIEAPPKIEIGKKKEFAPGRSFRPLRFAGQATVELFGPEPTLAAINRELRRDFDTGKDAIQEYFDKRREFLGRVGVPAEDENTTEPEYWTSQWLSIRNYTWAAGTGRSGISWFYRTWDVQTGKQVDLWTWFGSRKESLHVPGAGPVVATSGGSMTPKLRLALPLLQSLLLQLLVLRRSFTA